MSISIVDYTGEYVYPDLLPKSAIVIIVCKENTAVPDSLNARFLTDLDLSNVFKGGCFVFRAGTKFNFGCSLGTLYSILPDSKLFTFRQDIFSSIIPAKNIELLNLPAVPSAKVNKSESSGEAILKNAKYSEIYHETLNKFSKTFLLDCSLRAVKAKSLKAQAKNIAEGVIISYTKKWGKTQSINSESLVSDIFEDLEREGVLNISLGSVEYNDVVIESCFGHNKTKIFVPGFKRQVISKPNTAANTFKTSQIQPSPNPVFSKPDQPLCQNLKKNYLPQPADFSNTQVNPPKSLISTTRQIPNGEDWESHESAVTELIIEEISKTDEIDSCLKLYRLCNVAIRDYFTGCNMSLSEDKRAEIIKKCLKFAFITFYKTDPPADPETILENIAAYGLTKLTKI